MDSFRLGNWSANYCAAPAGLQSLTGFGLSKIGQHFGLLKSSVIKKIISGDQTVGRFRFLWITRLRLTVREASCRFGGHLVNCYFEVFHAIPFGDVTALNGRRASHASSHPGRDWPQVLLSMPLAKARCDIGETPASYLRSDPVGLLSCADIGLCTFSALLR